ncbi:MAG TPA: hypothetical protein VH835_06240, partial [Dongiaceae bacterium]
ACASSASGMTAPIATIASASQEQSLGVQQVDDSVTQMEVVTHKNAALVEESTASLTSVDQQVDQLLNVISFFKTTQTTAAPATKTGAKQLQGKLEQQFPAAAASPLRRQAAAAPAPKAAAGGSNGDWSEF